MIAGLAHTRADMRRHRHRRSWGRRLRQSFRGVGVVFVLVLVGAVARVWIVLPAVDTAFSTFMGMPDASAIADLERKARGR
ncbi:MAG: hypothetical protein FJZ38_17260 [Candidatus Rokubacteria bacterium]|nr:hypothetical protein [Candidatus Rokubacteria bacterium]